MKKTHSIRLFFILTAIIVIACFWLGFQFGKRSQEQTDLAKYSEKYIAEVENSSSGNTVSDNLSDNEEKTSVGLEEEDLPEKETENSTDSDQAVNTEDYLTPNFYLKNAGEYLTVYVAATDEVYFETDLKAADLPVELQEQADTGIPFYDLEDLYHFLENYSS